ncbi:DUF6153 family protein [Amycolatopsis eburnea]|uniref:Uncharacterized protein n=1 Tax=Amycolatopsis eburnea TaxID=2267691 RepID=A0A427T423_9PSEU|nr:DUF6153 family protein [Amycolatopsis eburnea]RSD13553.1 hypothetical protein EIY87_27990 [Amycolatopsis eburnea]
MTKTRLGNVQQVLLLCALAVCVLAMHHVSLSHGMGDAAATATAHVAPGFEPEMAVAAPDGGAGEHHPGMPNDLLHLCLAVLYAAGALLLALAAFLGLSWLNTTFPRFTGLRGSPRRGRPPDRGGRGILTSLCILRT